ncbi:MAG: TIGR02206 family membrane protein [Bacteroidota bacterium]|nr:TIGR02206 family membrane protein [Bacteroidota bacterium]
MFDSSEFIAFGHVHWMALGLMVACAIGLPWYARGHLGSAEQLIVARVMAAVISVTVAVWSVYRLITGEFDGSKDLPLDLCNLIALLIVVLMWNPSLVKHEILYYLVLSGTLQGTITPNLDESFPHYNFLKYWIAHGGLVIFMVYVSVVFRLYPRFQSILRAYIFVNIYAVVMLAYNLAAGTNYFYTMAKPPIPSLLDYMGPWPWYLLTGQVLALFLFWLSWLPMAALARVLPDSSLIERRDTELNPVAA